MKAWMFPLICLFVIVGVIAIAHAGLTTDQANWAEQKGAGSCTFRDNTCYSPKAPSCGGCTWFTCPDRTSTGYSRSCSNAGYNTGNADGGTQSCGKKKYKKTDCRVKWIWGSCYCRANGVSTYGPTLYECRLNRC